VLDRNLYLHTRDTGKPKRMKERCQPDNVKKVILLFIGEERR
jgi:hypothetical protein